MKKIWLFPDVPPFLAGLTRELPVRLRELVTRHGIKLARSKDYDILCLKAIDPEPMVLISGGTPQAPHALILDADGKVHDDHVTIVMEEAGTRTMLVWSPRITLKAVLLNLSADAVIKTSDLEKSGKDGSN